MIQEMPRRTWEAALSRLHSYKRAMRGMRMWRMMAKNPDLRRVKRAIFGGRSSNRFYVPSGMTLEHFFAELNRQEVQYVVLRWFEDLPHLDLGEDLDLLVYEDDASRIATLLSRTEQRGAIPLDVYSSQGRFMAGRGGVAYYPPQLAERIINGSVRHPSGACVPNLEDHFHSLAFHALYHKGYVSGIPVDAGSPPNLNSEHDYASVLAHLANRLGVEVPITLVDLDRYLAGVGWRPPLDTMAKWSLANDWCRRLYEEGLADIDAPKGLMVAIVREEAREATDDIADLFREAGLQITEIRTLDHAVVERATEQLRGGNWGRGLYPQSAGKPYAAIVAIDPTPIEPSSMEIAKYPGLDNARINHVKSNVRDWWNGQVQPSRRSNVLHTSDSAAQAVHYLAILDIHLNGQEPG